jgi:hypothetical protein
LTNLTPAARTVLDDTTTGAMLATLGGQPLDGDLTAISALVGTNTIYYRSATDIWSPVTFSGLSFSGGVLTVTAGGGNVNNSGTPTNLQYARWTDATHIAGVAPATVLSDIGGAPLASPVFTGDPKAPTPTPGDNDTSIATTAFVTAAVAAVGGGFTQFKETVISTTQTFTRDVNTKFLLLEGVGGGGGGGGATCTTGRSGGGAGGGSGGYSRRIVTAATFGASQLVTIGAAGVGGTQGGGGVGGNTSIGALLIANGGQGGSAGSDTGGGLGGMGGAGAGGVGDLIAPGNPGSYGMGADTATVIAPAGGAGGNSYFGAGARGSYAYSAFNGESAPGLGGGGAGGRAYNSSSGLGGSGGGGVAIITEFI